MKYFNFLFLLMTSCASSLYLQESAASFAEPKRLLLLDGDDGTVACRVYGTLLSATLPRLSDNWTFESATRSLLRMKNLTAVRGVPGASMVGPVDYFGNLEDPHQYLYTISQNEFPPLFYRKAVTEQGESDLRRFDNNLIIEEGCIHGDTTLNGFFMMGMTSDHTTMRTADTVFLKYPVTKGNVGMHLAGGRENGQIGFLPLPPYVIYKGATENDRKTFDDLTKGKSFIFNPFSREYWR